MKYADMSKEQLLNEKKRLEQKYNDYKAMNLNLDM